MRKKRLRKWLIRKLGGVPVSEFPVEFKTKELKAIDLNFSVTIDPAIEVYPEEYVLDLCNRQFADNLVKCIVAHKLYSVKRVCSYSARPDYFYYTVRVLKGGDTNGD